jgi:predicted GNAT family N-acyltransferase
MKLSISVLEKRHDKSAFCCGYHLLDDYLKKQAKQDVNRDLSACFVLVDEHHVVKGYYSLSANSINRDVFSNEMNKKLPPSYTNIPTILLGRLAIDVSIKGKGWGEILLMDALHRSYTISETIVSMAVVVDPIDEQAQHFYGRYGFIRLPKSGKMFLPMKTLGDLFHH